MPRKEIIGVGIVATTHDHEYGVSAGVVESFKKCLTENDIDPKEVIHRSLHDAGNQCFGGR